MSDNSERTFVAGPEFSITLSAPFSHFAEALRAVKLAADNFSPAPANVLGITSSLPKEGKTTVAANLARLVGQTAGSVLLIDADLRNPALSQHLVPLGAPGLSELLQGSVGVGDVLWADPLIDLHFLPAGAVGQRIGSGEVLASQAMHVLMNQLRARYAFIVVDLPPIMPIVDVKAAAQFLDAFALVVQWGGITSDLVVEAMRESGIDTKIVGTLLNKVNVAQLRKVDWHLSNRATRIYYQSYRHIA